MNIILIDMRGQPTPRGVCTEGTRPAGYAREKTEENRGCGRNGLRWKLTIHQNEDMNSLRARESARESNLELGIDLTLKHARRPRTDIQPRKKRK